MTPDGKVDSAVSWLRTHGYDGRFDCALVLGTGIGGVVDGLADAVSTRYDEIPHVPAATVGGHDGRLVAGRLGSRRILAFAGRSHAYETGDPAAMRVPIGIVASLGSPPLLLTSACGALDPALRPGSLVLVSDHIKLGDMNPLVGEADDRRFVSLNGAYDGRLRARLLDAAAASRIDLREGVYMWFAGPSFETPAEIRMARGLGADVVGMSVAPEVILARFYGLRVAAVSLVTNLAAGLGPAEPAHADTKRVAAESAPALRRLIAAFLSGLDPV